MPKFNITLSHERIYEAEVEAESLDDANEVAAQLIDSGEYKNFISSDVGIELVAVDPIIAADRKAA